MLPLGEKVTFCADRSMLWKKRSDPSFKFCWHFHPEFELTLIENSRGKRYVGSSMENYHPGDLVLLGPDLPHTWQSYETAASAKHTAFVVQFTASWLEKAVDGAPEWQRIERLLKRASTGLAFSNSVALKIKPAIVEMKSQSALERLLNLLKLLDILSRVKDVRVLSTAQAPVLPVKDRTRLQAILNFLHEGYRYEVMLDEVAQAAHLTPAACCRFFRKKMGRTVFEYLNELRIEYVARLLRESDLKILTLASEAGYRNLSHFNRQFRKIKGIDPSSYRAAMSIHSNDMDR